MEGRKDEERKRRTGGNKNNERRMKGFRKHVNSFVVAGR